MNTLLLNQYIKVHFITINLFYSWEKTQYLIWHEIVADIKYFQQAALEFLLRVAVFCNF